jgi:FemAB-related protein (PEP-CTERM system-associated)
MTEHLHSVRHAVTGAPHVTLWTDGRAWDRYVAAAADSNVGHRWGWLEVVAGTYGHPVLPLAAVRPDPAHGERIVGVLPLVLVASRLFGRSLVSMPYLDSGGLCSGTDPATGESDPAEAAVQGALVAAAATLAEQQQANLELRHLSPKQLPMPVGLEKVTFTLDVSAGEEDVWSRIKSNRRGQVRKAGRAGLTARVGGPDDVDAFYRVWAHNMRDLGSPVHPRSFFDRILATFPGDAHVVLVEDDETPVGAGIVLRHGDRTVLPWSSSLREALSKGPNQLLYWAALRHAIATGARTFDFGRSSRDAGTYEAKREWGAEPQQLYWHGTSDDGGSRLDRLSWACEVWRRLPLGVTVTLGSRIRGSISR